METKVKSHISNKTYSTLLNTIEEDDQNVMSELYMLPISGHNILVAPGKSRMDDTGVAFCYVYVIQNSKVVCKLGVYEKKSDTMPVIFDISTFPEGSFCLFEEFEKNPSRLIDLEMKEEPSATVFDVLTKMYSKIKDKKKRLKTAYKELFEAYSKEKDKEMKPILKIISTASKEDDPTDTFLQTLNEGAVNTTLFVYTLLALQNVFEVEFLFRTDEEKYNDIKKKWPMDSKKTLWVDLETREVVEPEPVAEPVTEPVAEKEVDLDESIKMSDTKLDESIKMSDTKLDESVEPVAQEEPAAQPEPAIQEEPEPVAEPQAEPAEEPEELEPIEEVDLDKVTPVKKTRKPSKAKEPEEAKKTTKKKTPKRIGTSLNLGTVPAKIKAPRKLKLKEETAK